MLIVENFEIYIEAYCLFAFLMLFIANEYTIYPTRNLYKLRYNQNVIKVGKFYLDTQHLLFIFSKEQLFILMYENGDLELPIKKNTKVFMNKAFLSRSNDDHLWMPYKDLSFKESLEKYIEVKGLKVLIQYED